MHYKDVVSEKRLRGRLVQQVQNAQRDEVCRGVCESEDDKGDAPELGEDEGGDDDASDARIGSEEDREFDHLSPRHDNVAKGNSRATGVAKRKASRSKRL